nr:MAG TPA: hypothetical protein [Caudoviricetes sp.]
MIVAFFYKKIYSLFFYKILLINSLNLISQNKKAPIT